MYDIIPLILILLSSIVILFIVIKKFPALANLDIDTVQAEKEVKFKEKIISNRIKRNVKQTSAGVASFFNPFFKAIVDGVKWSYAKLHELRDKYKAEAILSPEEIKTKIEALFIGAEEMDKKNDLDETEKYLIEIIGLESQSIKAFKMLGQIYLRKKNYDDAEQTFEHILRLLENEEEALLKTPGISEDELKNRQQEINHDKCLAWESLSFVAQNDNDFDLAIANIRQALALDANSPRLLDTLLEISIIKKDKVSALDAYDKLSSVNPENQKLSELKEKIREL